MYNFVYNNPIGNFDYLGREGIELGGFFWDKVEEVIMGTGNAIFFPKITAKKAWESMQGWWIKRDYTNFANYLREGSYSNGCTAAARNRATMSGTGKESAYKKFKISKPLISSLGEVAAGAVNAGLGGDTYYNNIELENFNYLKQHTYGTPAGGYYPKKYKVPYKEVMNWKMGSSANAGAMAAGFATYLGPDSFATIYIRIDKCGLCWDASHSQYGVLSEHKEAVATLKVWYKRLGMTPPF